MSKEQFLQEHIKSMGGHDLASIRGEDEYQDAYKVWLNKTTGLSALDNKYMERGRVLEPLVLKMYERDSGDKSVIWTPSKKIIPVVNEPLMFRREDQPLFHATPDGFIENPKLGVGVIEAKTMRQQLFWKVKTDGIPKKFKTQLQWYLNILGLSWGAVAILCPDEWELVYEIIMADPTAQKEMSQQALDFWHEYVVKEAPPFDYKPAQLNSEEMEDTRDTIVIESEHWKTISESYWEAKAKVEAAKKELEIVESQFKKAMGKFQSVRGGDTRVDWKLQFKKSHIDVDRLREELPDIARKYEKQTRPSRPFRVYKVGGKK